MGTPPTDPEQDRAAAPATGPSSPAPQVPNREPAADQAPPSSIVEAEPQSDIRPELPLWTGNELPTGKWERRDGVLYEPSDGNAIWRLRKTDPAAEPPSEERSAGTPDPGLWDGLDFASAIQAWEEYVPADQGGAEEFRVAVEEGLRQLDQALERVDASPAPTAAPDAPMAAEQVEQAADAVNTALDAVDTDEERTASFRDSPEWQQLQTIRGAVRHVWDTIQERTGAYWSALRNDVRFQGFWKTVSIRSCEAIAKLATAAADRIRRSTAGDLPTADALMSLSDTAITYSSLASEHNGQPQAAMSGNQLDEVGQLRQAAGMVSDIEPAVRAAQEAAPPDRDALSGRTGAPLAYQSRDDATGVCRDIAQAFQAWIATPMGQQLTRSEHPRVQAFREAWQQLPPADLPTGPGPAAGPYGEVAERARAVVEEAAAAGGRFAGADIAALRAVSDAAGQHAGRLSVTLPGSMAPAPVRTAAPQAPAPRLRVAAPMPPTASGGPRVSA